MPTHAKPDHDMLKPTYLPAIATYRLIMFYYHTVKQVVFDSSLYPTPGVGFSNLVW